MHSILGLGALAFVLGGCLGSCSRDGDREPGASTPPRDGGSDDAAATALVLTPHGEPGAYLDALASKLAAAVPPMPEARFWELVSQIDWGGRVRSGHVDLDALGAALAARVTIEDCLAAENTGYGLKWRLEERLQSWERTSGEDIELGDDRFGDLAAHVIGLGRDELAHVMATPRLAQERARRKDFTENFFYVFSRARQRYPQAELVTALRTRLQVRSWDGGQPLPADAALVSHPVDGLGVVLTDPRRVVFARGTMRP